MNLRSHFAARKLLDKDPQFRIVKLEGHELYRVEQWRRRFFRWDCRPLSSYAPDTLDYAKIYLKQAKAKEAQRIARKVPGAWKEINA